MKRALPFLDSAEWHWRWCQMENGSRLHRIVAGEKRDGNEPEMFVGVANARTACGIRAPRAFMPGIFSRMDAQRCPACCDKIGIERGRGAPYNHRIAEPGESPRP